MSDNLQSLPEDFIKEAKLESVATAIVDLDGKELAYAIHGTFDSEFNSQRAASLFSMVVNFLNKTLGGIHFAEDEVEEIMVTSNHGHFLLEIIKHEKCFLGVAISKEEDSNRIRTLIKKYKPLFLAQL
jgi:predicted regulator of Ras-like GTPase activity (Roadblock/LC7/MglB family)